MTRTGPVEQLGAVIAALADSTRRALFEAIVATPGLTTSQLAARTRSMSRWGVIKHLGVLRDAGLLQTMATGRLRRHYAEKAALDPLLAWLESIGR